MNVESLEQIVYGTLTWDIRKLLNEAIEIAIANGKRLEAEKPDATSRTISSYIHDEMCANTVRLLHKLPELGRRVYVRRARGTLMLIIDNGKLVIRLKKMTRAGVTSNIVTQTVLEFEQMSLFDDEMVKLSVGYCYKHSGLDYEILISHPNGLHKVDWCKPLIRENENIKQLVTGNRTQPADGRRKRKIGPRKGAVKHAENDKS